ncbi:MAG: hypothetical protein Q7R88_02675 [bacterium]|nr:hypothetical protein [bacterium]
MFRLFWSGISRVFPFVRDMLLGLGLIWHEGRQRYSLGFLKPERTMEELLAHVKEQGFSNHFIAWVDDGELCSLRRIAADPRYQYHLRIFKDGEVRGHYECTPEAHPIWHFTERGLEERREEFLTFLEGWIVSR